MAVVLFGAAFLALAAKLAARAYRWDGYLSPVTVFALGAFLYLMSIPIEMGLTGQDTLWLRTPVVVTPEVRVQVVIGGWLALLSFALGYRAFVRRDGAFPPAPPPVQAVRSVSVLMTLAAAVCIGSLLTAFRTELMSLSAYDASYATRYSSPLFSIVMQWSEMIVAMLGYVRLRYAKAGWRTGIPLVVGAMFAVFLRRPRAKVRLGRMTISLAILPIVLAFAAVAFSINRGGGDVGDIVHAAQSRPGYATTIEPAGPFASLQAQLGTTGGAVPDAQLGQSIISGLAGWIPRALWPSRPLDLAEQFGRLHIPGWTPGQGYGFSALAEAMMLGNTWFGVLIYFSLLGAAFAGMRNLWMRTSGSSGARSLVWDAFYSVYLLSALFVLFRGPLQALVTPTVQAGALVALLALLLPANPTGSAVESDGKLGTRGGRGQVQRP